MQKVQLRQRAFGRLRRPEDNSARPKKPGSLEIKLAKHRARFGIYYCDQPPEYARAWDATQRILARPNREVRVAGARLLVMTVPSIESVRASARTSGVQKLAQLKGEGHCPVPI